jgi:hypothetical protein
MMMMNIEAARVTIMLMMMVVVSAF